MLKENIVFAKTALEKRKKIEMPKICLNCGKPDSLCRENGKNRFRCLRCRKRIILEDMFSGSHSPLEIWEKCIELIEKNDGNIGNRRLSKQMGVSRDIAGRMKKIICGGMKKYFFIKSKRKNEKLAELTLFNQTLKEEIINVNK